MARNNTSVPTIAAIPVSNNYNNDPELALALADANISSTRTNGSVLLSASAIPDIQVPRSLAVARAEIALSTGREEDSIPTALASLRGRSNNCSSSNNNNVARTRTQTTRQTLARTETNHHRATTTDSERSTTGSAETTSDDGPACYDRHGNKIPACQWVWLVSLLVLLSVGLLSIVAKEKEEKVGYSHGTDNSYHSPFPTTPFPTRSPTTARPTPTRAPTPRPTPAPTVFGYVGEIEAEGGIYIKPDYNESLPIAYNYPFWGTDDLQGCVQRCQDNQAAVYFHIVLNLGKCACLDEVPNTCLLSDEELAAARHEVEVGHIYSHVPLPSDCVTGREDHVENSSAPPSAAPSSSLHTPSQQLPSSSISELPSQAPTIAPSPK